MAMTDDDTEAGRDARHAERMRRIKAARGPVDPRRNDS